jgi:hypothetical protein
VQSIVKKYDAKLDDKKRITIRDSKYDFYHVEEFEDGTLVLKPRVLVDPNEISEKTLRMMDKSMKNLKNGIVSKPLELEKYLKLTDNS